jgi:hypothetical protein
MQKQDEHTPNPPAAVEPTQPCVLAARRLMMGRSCLGPAGTPPPVRKPWEGGLARRLHRGGRAAPRVGRRGRLGRGHVRRDRRSADDGAAARDELRGAA